MSILGVESVIFEVGDLAEDTRFWSDFGLPLVSSSADESVFQVASGSRVVLHSHGHAALPTPDSFQGNGLKETIWGVDTAANLETLVAGLATDRTVTRDADGTAHFVADDGQPIGLRVWAKRAVISEASAVNSPGNIKRLNQHRIWRHKAIPKTINHVVFFSPDYIGSMEFYRDRLGFRYTDHSKGVGIFARADGTNEHHSIFWLNCDLPFAPDFFKFMHIAFGMDDIDEVMLGANIMENKGWKNTSMNSSGGISRHRISSAIYYYCDIPGKAGEAEYHADTDYLDDNWVPRAWDFKFGSLLWAHNAPPIFRGDDIPWDMAFDKDGASLAPFRKAPKAAPLSAAHQALTTEDEHAL
jgi:catechol 2,3-dioxygenase-like lactoylglutathione lyase family enzyme